MRIGFDGKRATNNLTGLGNYSRSLIEQLAAFFPQNQYFVYTPKIKDNARISYFLGIKNILTKLPETAAPLWRTAGIKKQLVKDQIAVFHGLSHELPLGLRKTGIPGIVTMHDLIFLKFPQYFDFIDRMIYHIKCRYACKHAERIVAISECTKRDIISFFHTDPAKIQVIYQSCDDLFKTPANEGIRYTVRKKYQLPAKYILNVGTIETRKNLITLIKALPEIDPNYPLVVVGKPTAYKKEVEQEIITLGLTARVIFLQNIPFDDLPTIYQMASLFVYPSLYEGFGIPIIEALYSGVPVVAATGSCLEEAGGPGSRYVDPTDHNGFAAAINEILASQSTQEQMRTEGLTYVQRFNNEIITSEIMDLYKKVIAAHKINEHAKDRD